MKRICIIFLVISAATAQMRPPDQFNRQHEIVSMASSVDFPTAIELLSEYAIESRGKPIYDPTSQSGKINVDVNNLPWEKALEIILSRRGLWYEERQHYLQIIKPDAADEEDEMTGIKVGTDSREIQIETIFFEGNRRELNEIGIDWSTFYRGEIDLTAHQLGALEVTDEQFMVGVKIPDRLFSVDLDILLRAFDSQSIGDVLAQPRVVVTEGNTGKIQVGQDFSIKTRDFAGNVMDEFFSVGTILEVTPYILLDPDDRPSIVLDTHVERSSASPDVVSTVINKTEANSTIQLYDGEETLIAGLYSTESSHTRRGVPFLKDLPWWFFGLRYVFGYNQNEQTQKELIVVLKASILPAVHDRRGTASVSKNIVRMPFRSLKPYRREETPNEERMQSSLQPSVSTQPQPRVAPPERIASQSSTRTDSKPSRDQNKSRNVQPKADSERLVHARVIGKHDDLVVVEWKQRLNNADVNGTTGRFYRQVAMNDLERLQKGTVLNGRNNRSVVSLNEKNASGIRMDDIFTIRIQNE